MLSKLTAWLRRLHPAGSPAATPTAPAAADYDQVRYEDARGRVLADAAGAARRIGCRELPDGARETETWELAPPAWLSIRTREHSAAGRYHYRRTHYFPWGQEQRRVALAIDEDGPARTDYHAYFPTGELRRHRCRLGGQLRTVYAFREPEEGEAYTHVEAMPEYPGGMEQFLRDLQPLLKYPVGARIKGQQGRIGISFTVGADGRMSDFKAPPEAAPALAAAGIQALQQLAAHKRWRPGHQNRRLVRVSYTVPLTFTI
jgi:hypothetical protein